MNSCSYSASELRTQQESIRSHSQFECQNVCCIAIEYTFQRLKNGWCRIQAYTNNCQSVKWVVFGLKEAGWANQRITRVFCYVSRLKLCSDGRRRRGRRVQGQRTDPGFNILCHTDNRQRVMVWGIISFDSRTPLAVVRGKSTTTSVIAHQTEKKWISANEKNRQRIEQTHAEGPAEQHTAILKDAHLRAHHSCFTTLERCQPETAHLRQTGLCGEQSHNNSHLAFQYNPVEDSRFMQQVFINTITDMYPYCNAM
ncbi:hypothetical protein TNCV_1724891 [Trichonephila clavipes]|nr:hypothetical protein TNCV_1724891 [Trichonephila clavipes]